MTTYETVLLTVLAVSMILFYIVLTVAAVAGVKLINSARQVVEKADEVADAVAEAAESVRDAQGKLMFFKLVRNIIKFAQKQKRSRK